MQLRSPARVRQDQARLRKEFALLRNLDMAEFSDTSEASPGEIVGRVSAVVSTDPVLGPHMLIIKQRFSGTPPQPSDTNSSTRVLYPTPSRTVNDYAVNEYVRVVRTDGANFAAKFA